MKNDDDDEPKSPDKAYVKFGDRLEPGYSACYVDSPNPRSPKSFVSDSHGYAY